DFACAVVDPEVLRAFEAALGELGHAGATVEDVTIPSLDHAGPALGALILGEARSALAPLLRNRWERVSVELRVYLELGKLVGAGQYLAAQRLRTRLYDEMRAALARVDLLATPATVLAAPRLDELQVRVPRLPGPGAGAPAPLRFGAVGQGSGSDRPVRRLIGAPTAPPLPCCAVSRTAGSARGRPAG